MPQARKGGGTPPGYWAISISLRAPTTFAIPISLIHPAALAVDVGSWKLIQAMANKKML